MCGIVGYIGDNNATPVLLDGLEKLEYRGYDSAGIAIHTNKGLRVLKEKGRLKNLSDAIDNCENFCGCVGIGHTRWATHGKPSKINAHPHLSDLGKIAVVHNGIIENYLELKDFLTNNSKKFISDTDSETVAQLIEYFYKGDLLDAVIKSLNKLVGSYSLVIMCKDEPDKIIAVRKDNPLIIGIGENENYIASDIPAILSKTREILRLEDNEIAVVTKDKVVLYNENKDIINKNPIHIDWDISSAEKQGYDHFMMKEIMEQPSAVKETIKPRIKDGKVIFDDIALSKEYLDKLNKIFIVACGSAYHVGCVAKYILEETIRKPVEVDLASEFRYRNPLVDENTLIIVISQSGETADTLAALREGKKLGAKVLSIVNVVGSSIANDSDDVIYTWAGPEIAVATTKAYSTQLAVIYMLALYMADKLELMSKDKYEYYISQLEILPNKIDEVLSSLDTIKSFAESNYDVNDAFFIGRNFDYAVSLEGSLKLKEISYIPSEAYAAGELKHGTISLIEDNTLVVVTATNPELIDKIASNIREVKARGASVLAITTKEHEKVISQMADHVLVIPSCCNMMLPSLSVIPLQLLSYFVALNRGCDIDKPRNLAKSVTVE